LGGWIVATQAASEPLNGGSKPSATTFHAAALNEARAGRWGRALAELRQTETLLPGNPTVQSNLQIVRNQLNQSAPANPLHGLARLPTNFWAGVTLLATWTTALLWLAGWVRPALGSSLENARRIAIATALLAGSLLGLSRLGRRLTPNVVVIARDAAYRQGPVDAAKKLGSVPEGAELRIFREHRGWYEVGPAEVRSRPAGWLAPGEVRVIGQF